MNKPNKVIIVRIGELFLKGKNRKYFENKLTSALRKKLSDVNCFLSCQRNRYAVSDYDEAIESEIIGRLKTVFGIHSISPGICIPTDFEQLSQIVPDITPNVGSFRISAKRGDKTFPHTSVDICRILGERMLLAKPGLRVDLHNPDFTVNVDVREQGVTYVFFERIPGAGGMPVGTAGRGLLLLSGGIDSPVAGYMAAKRGLSLEALHFHSYPYTSEAAQAKVEKLADILENYCDKITLLMVPFTKIQEAIHRYCHESFMITIMRRCMMRIAERVAKQRGLGCIVNGESLGQVASQTLESITVTNAVVADLPIFRPVIGFDKQEIVDIALKIGTYETSIEPYEDCCTVFLPDSPAIKPKLEQCLVEEAQIPDLEKLLTEAVNGIEIRQNQAKQKEG